MKNQEIAQILFEIGDFLDIEEIPFKPRAYQMAALSLDNLEEDVVKIYKERGLRGIEDIPGIGESIALKIEEYLKTGKIKYFQELKKKTPVDMETLLSIEGLGAKRIKILYKELGIKSLKQLEKALNEHKIAGLFGFGEKTERNILQGIEFLKQSKGRFLLSELEDDVAIILERLRKMKEVGEISLAGSYRRRKETVGDLDILISSSFPSKVMSNFCTMPEVVKIWGRGETKSSVRMKKGYDVDLRVIEKSSFGAALQYFTGSKEHNIHLRKIAMKKGYKLNEYGLFRNERYVVGRREEDIYKKLGFEYIPPELREDRGELNTKQLPKLVELRDIRGDLHCHTSWNGGMHSIKEMADRAKEMGYEYIGISDHTKTLRIENGLDEKDLSKQRKEIDGLNKKGYKILQGAEVNILKTGALDIKDSALEKLDYVAAGIHSSLKMKKEVMTKRIIKAMKNPNLNILTHPTGRILKRREPYELDMEQIMKAAREYSVVLEINSSYRLDLNDIYIKIAKEIGCKIVINSDAHKKEQLRRVEYGVFQARRGWAEKCDIINTKTYKQIKNFLSKK